MKKDHLKLAEKPALFLPLAAARDVIAIVGRRGRGKTVTAKVIVEEAHAAGTRFCTVDPTGAWWGLRSSADGDGPGIPCVVFGGDHGQVPLEPTAGEVMADFVADPTQPSCVLDVSTWTRGEQIRFLTAFLARLYQKNRHPLLLVLDEADQVAPQQKEEKRENFLLGAAQRIVKLGRVKGFGVVLVTQRPASLNKNVLTQAAILIAHGLTGPQDHKAVLDWIKHQADSESYTPKVMESLPSLGLGEAWVWAPELGILERVQIRPTRTFDSSRAPVQGVVTEPKAVAEVDLGKLTAAIQATVERARENDPVALKARIRELEAKRPAAPDGEAEAAAARIAWLELEVREAGARERNVHNEIARIVSMMRGFHEDITKAASGALHGPAVELMDLLDSLKVAAGGHNSARSAELRPPLSTRRPEIASKPAQRAPIQRVSHVDRPAWNEGKAGPRQRILNALAELADLGIPMPPRVQLAFFANYTNARSKGFANALGALRSEGLVDYSGDCVRLTDEGARHALPVGRRRSVAERQDDIIRQLGGVHERVLRPVLKAYPDPIFRTDLAAAAGYTNTRSKGFANALGRLRTFGFIDYVGGGAQVQATDVLFVS